MLKEIRRKNVIIPLPFGIGKFQLFMQLLPKPILTIDQIKILESGDNIITGKNNTFSDLSIFASFSREHCTYIFKISPSYGSIY